jgi:4-hydroxy-tetrahydrodipicolinate reductase
MRVLLIGHGRMGRLVEALAPEYGATLSAVVTSHNASTLEHLSRESADVAIDFSVAQAVPATVRALARIGVNVVIGTTGWSSREADVRSVAEHGGLGVVAAANFSLGMALFETIVDEAAERFRAQPSYGAWIHELHHRAKRDAPSGTALQLEAAMQRAGYAAPIDVASSRAGAIPGTHTVGFDGPSDTITLTHTVRDRAVFARGALEAARWVQGRQGWFSMRDVVR